MDDVLKLMQPVAKFYCQLGLMHVMFVMSLYGLYDD